MAGFDWDQANIEHIARHGISPSQVEQVFANDPVEKARANRKGEARFIVQGRDDSGRSLLVVATLRGEKIRPITAHRVHREEENK